MIVDVDAAYSPTNGGQLAPTTIARLLDTREPSGTTTGSPALAGTTRVIAVTGVGTIPSNAIAAVLNVAVDAPQGSGFVSVFPCGSPVPVAANVNFTSGTTVSNAVMVGIGTGGKVCVFTSATTHLVVDVDLVFAGAQSG